MTAIGRFLAGSLLLAGLGCKTEVQQTTEIPNGDFELWDNSQLLYNWRTNSCPICVPPYETYVVQKVTDVAHGQFAAKFIFNNVYPSWAINKFAISSHPAALTAYMKSTMSAGDTAIILVDIFKGNVVVDTGIFYETTSTLQYKRVVIPVSQDNALADSALIKIVGGKKQNSELYVDNFAFAY